MANIRFPRDNLDATTDPGVGDDAADGYGPFSRWYNNATKIAWYCTDDSIGAAKWAQLAPSSLLSQLTTAAGTAPTGLWIPGVETFSDAGVTPINSGENVGRINDLTGNGYHLDENAADTGPVFGTVGGGSGIGTCSSLDFTSGNSNGLQSILDFDGATPNLLGGSTNSMAVVVDLPDNNVDQAQANRNPPILGQDDTDGRPYTVWRDNTTRLIGTNGAGGGASSISSTFAPYDTPLVISNRFTTANGYAVGADKTYDTRKGAAVGDLVLTRRLRLGYNTDDLGSLVYLTGKIGPTSAWNVDLSDAQMDAVVDVLRAFCGLSPV